MRSRAKACGVWVWSTAVVAALAAAVSATAAEPSGKPAYIEPGPRPPAVKPTDPAVLQAAIDRGIKFLLVRQNEDGSWGSAHNTKGLNIYAPVPGAHQAFRTGVTSLCIAALLETAPDEGDVALAVDRGEAWLVENLPHLRRATPDALYNNWGHAYAIQALVRMYQRHPDDKKRQRQIMQLIQSQIEMLDRYECVDGGWCYYDFDFGTQKPAGSSISFVSATVLVAFHEAKQIGADVPQRLVDRAMASIRRQRKPDFSYIYGEYLKWIPMHPVNCPGGSLGRSQACNLAMRYWGDRTVSDEVLTVWLDRLFARNGWLSIGRKRPIPHESWFSVAGYFYYYGHYYAARCIEELPEADRRPYWDQLTHVLLALQEKDGSWWDYPLYDYHQQYGTAFALMALGRCRDR